MQMTCLYIYIPCHTIYIYIYLLCYEMLYVCLYALLLPYIYMYGKQTHTCLHTCTAHTHFENQSSSVDWHLCILADMCLYSLYMPACHMPACTAMPCHSIHSPSPASPSALRTGGEHMALHGPSSWQWQQAGTVA